MPSTGVLVAHSPVLMLLMLAPSQVGITGTGRLPPTNALLEGCQTGCQVAWPVSINKHSNGLSPACLRVGCPLCCLMQEGLDCRGLMPVGPTLPGLL
jgi:hypothetical protein